MTRLTMPRFHFLQHSQLGEDSCHSVLISLLRGLAALQVAAAHQRAELLPGFRTIQDPSLWYQGLAFATGFAHQAVLVFFVISGWLVGGSFLNKMGQPNAVASYAIDRVSRLWTVLIPTFLLILALGMVTGSVDPRNPDFGASNPYSATVFAANLAGLQDIVVPEFGDNFPLWSLANESWYYLLFPMLVLATGAAASRHRSWLWAGLGAATLLLPLSLVLYFGIWLLGAIFSRIRIECGTLTRVALLGLLVGLSVWFRLKGNNDDMSADSFQQDLLLSLVFLLLLSSTVMPLQGHSVVTAIKPAATLLSNFSFTLYVVHVPVIRFLAWTSSVTTGQAKLDPASLAGLAGYAVLLSVVVLCSYGFYRLFEANTYRVRRWLKSRLLGRGPSTAVGAVES